MKDRYRIYKVQKTYHEAKTFCEAKGHNLVSIHNKYENAVMEQLLKDHGTWRMHYWLGMYAAPADNVFKWDYGSHINYQYKLVSPTLRCAKRRLGMSDVLTWTETNCAETAFFICKS